MANVSSETAGAKRGSARADEETVAAIYRGVNASQLAVLFKLEHRTVVRKLFEAQVKPCRTDNKTEYFMIRDAAPYLCKPPYDIEEAILKMSHKDLPKDLTKEYWAGQRSRQIFEENAGHLWRTEKVINEVGELMKIVKMSTLLMLDGVERQTELTDRQREIIKSLSHGMLNDLVKRVQEKFKVQEATNGQLQEADSEDSL